MHLQQLYFQLYLLMHYFHIYSFIFDFGKLSPQEWVWWAWSAETNLHKRDSTAKQLILRSLYVSLFCVKNLTDVILLFFFK